MDNSRWYGEAYDIGFKKGSARVAELEAQLVMLRETLRSIAIATEGKVSITLTGKEISELAELVGLQIVEHNYSDEYETEITVETPSGFLLNDDGVEEHYRLIAYLTEEPEDGAIGLGEAISVVPTTPANHYADDEHE